MEFFRRLFCTDLLLSIKSKIFWTTYLALIWHIFTSTLFHIHLVVLKIMKSVWGACLRDSLQCLFIWFVLLCVTRLQFESKLTNDVEHHTSCLQHLNSAHLRLCHGQKQVSFPWLVFNSKFNVNGFSLHDRFPSRLFQAFIHAKYIFQ